MWRAVQLFSFKTRTAAHGSFSRMNRLRGISAANIIYIIGRGWDTLEIGNFRYFRDLDHGSGHMTLSDIGLPSFSSHRPLYIPNFVQIGKPFVDGRTYVWMGGRAETGISTRGRPFSMDKSTETLRLRVTLQLGLHQMYGTACLSLSLYCPIL